MFIINNEEGSSLSKQYNNLTWYILANKHKLKHRGTGTYKTFLPNIITKEIAKCILIKQLEWVFTYLPLSYFMTYTAAQYYS